MDLRIVNKCNNNCLYCLEQSYRIRDDFISYSSIFNKISKNIINDKIINFYWWNPLLHPDLLSIITYCKSKWSNSIWILSNTYSLNNKILDELIESWLSLFWFYFNSFNKEKHDLIVNWWISYEDLLKNIDLISKSWIFIKVIIHVNNQNIASLARDILILYIKYNINNFEFINYFPFDRPYINKDILEYNLLENKQNINNLFLLIIKFNLKVTFNKFSRDFFWDFIQFYDYKRGIIRQIWKEDMERLNNKKNPFCLEEERCINCFIKDNCNFYLNK